MQKRDAGWLGLWGSGALGAGGSAFLRRAASGRLSAAPGRCGACLRPREKGTRSSGLIQVYVYNFTAVEILTSILK